MLYTCKRKKIQSNPADAGCQTGAKTERLIPERCTDTVSGMSNYHCQPVETPLDTVVRMPGSKSITNRALIAASLADGTSLLRGFLPADDTRLMIDALRSFDIAITVDESGAAAEVSGCGGHIPAGEGAVSCGNAGTVMRFCTALASLGHGRFKLDGVERMRQRPIGGLVDALKALGAGIEYAGAEGFPPLVVHGSGLHGGQVSFDSPASSQLISALLLVAPYASRDVMIEVRGDVPSVPYLRMTTAVMEQFGVAVIEQYEPDGARFIVEASQRYTASTFRIEPDASNATYFLAMPAILGGRLSVAGIGTASVQGDARFVDVLERMGCTVEREAARLTVRGPGGERRLRGVDEDLNDMPDTVQTLAAIALYAEGPTTIRNVANLRVKETDRLAALRTELTKLGARVEEREDGLRIVPPQRVRPATIETYADHRMAMSFALVGLKCPGLVIRDAECCRKTFPDFFERMEAACGVKRSR